MIEHLFSLVIHFYPNLLILLVLVFTFSGKPSRNIRILLPVFFVLLCICDHFALRFSERGTLLKELRRILLLLLYVFTAFCFAWSALEGWFLYHLSVITMWWFFYGVARSILFAAAQSVFPDPEAYVLLILVLNDVLLTAFSVFLCRLRIDSSLRIRPAILWCVCLLSVFVEELIISADNSFGKLAEIGLLPKVTVIVTSMALIVIFTYWCVSALLRQLETLFLKEHQRALQELELAFAREMYEASRKTAHDIRNHLLIMESLLEKTQYSRLQSYLNSYLKESRPFLQVVSSGNATVDAVLYRECQKAEKKGIPLHIDAVLPEKMGFSMTAFSAFLFNSIDNALEASMTVPEPEVRVSVRMQAPFCTITVTNRAPEHYLENHPGLESTKAEPGLHGYGTRIMRDFARKYNGDLQFSQEGELFRVSLMIQEAEDEIPNRDLRG